MLVVLLEDTAELVEINNEAKHKDDKRTRIVKYRARWPTELFGCVCVCFKEL